MPFDLQNDHVAEVSWDAGGEFSLAWTPTYFPPNVKNREEHFPLATVRLVKAKF